MTPPDVGGNGERPAHSYTVGGMSMVQLLWKSLTVSHTTKIAQILHNLKIAFPQRLPQRNGALSSYKKLVREWSYYSL